MKFGPQPVAEAVGAVLAHSVRAGDVRLKKGILLTADHVAALTRAGVGAVVTARLDAEDSDENSAAAALAAAVAGPAPRADFRVSEAFTGRGNRTASVGGVVRVARSAIDAVTAIDPAITIATLPDYARAAPGTMLATVKIIPYGVPRADVAAAARVVTPATLSVVPFQIGSAQVVLTETEALSDKALKKGETVLRGRLAALGIAAPEVVRVAHDAAPIAAALKASSAPLRLILGASATSDPLDVCPAGLVAAGGRLVRFGMPVDPGNLLFIGDLDGATVIGLPGCARSPALNGADWVLERVVAGLPVSGRDIAAMGVGGLLKEIPIRPQPRALRKPQQTAPRVAILLLGAGRSRRMRGADKLLERIDGVPLLRRSAVAATATGVETLVVLGPGDDARRAVLAGLGLRIVTADLAAVGMAESLKAGLAAMEAEIDAVIVALADMPAVSGADYQRLIAAFAPDAGREICRATAADGTPGQPVLFGRRFFESLAAITGDQGARDVVRAAPEFVHPVALEGDAALLDLDTPEDWAAFRARI